jgi:hypothetical protein
LTSRRCERILLHADRGLSTVERQEEERMAYYMEIRFNGPNERWQRNPNPFPSWDAADRAGQEFVRAHRPDPDMQKVLFETTRDPRYAPGTPNVEYHVVGG